MAELLVFLSFCPYPTCVLEHSGVNSGFFVSAASHLEYRRTPKRTEANPIVSTQVTCSPNTATEPSTVRTVLACATSCEPTAPRSLVTIICDMFSTVATMQEARTGIRNTCHFAWRMCEYGPRPSPAMEVNSMTKLEGKHVQNKSGTGPYFDLDSPVIKFCWRATFVDRATLARKQQRRATSEKFISPTTDMAHPIVTIAVGKRRRILNGIPIIITKATVTRQPVALMTSVKAADANESASFPTPQVALAIHFECLNNCN